MTGTKGDLCVTTITILGSIASVVGIVIALMTDNMKATIALISVIVALVVLIIYFIYILNTFIQKEYPEEYLKLSYFLTFEVLDETHSRLDGYRLIQSKRPILKQIHWGFKWTGSKQPVISSALQECNGKISRNGSSYDTVVLNLKRPLKFNETAVLHFHAEMDDIEKIAQPHLDVKIDAPISVVNYNVVLCNKDRNFNSNAKFMRMPISSDAPAAYETLATIAFNRTTRSYQHVLTNPEVGYYYRLEWEK